MRINKNTLRRLMIILVTVCILISCSLIAGLFHLGDEAAVGLFSLAATLVGTVFIAIELRNSQIVTCCDMLIDQNNYFHDNEHLMKVYSILEPSPAESGNPDQWKDVQPTDIACYCTFFENLYLLYRNKIAKIEDLDDLFGYRFFIFVNNPFVQEHHLLPTSSSYNEIFRLYAAWAEYRRKAGTPIPREEYAFSPAYLKGEYYLHDLSNARLDAPEKVILRDRPFVMRRLGFEDIADIQRVQQRACDQLADPSLFYPLSREEILESLHLDTLWGVFGEEGNLAAFALFVGCRHTERNLGKDADMSWDAAFTFDVVVSDPAWRGYGLQKLFIERAIAEARKAGAKAILATVSPQNSYSMENFLSKGFTVIKSGLSKYAGLERSLLSYKLCIE
jgi:GNAT superfamily N-acetyltransferase